MLPISASEKLIIGNPKNPNSVLDLLRTRGLTQTHIRNLISSRPILLLADLDIPSSPTWSCLNPWGSLALALPKCLAETHVCLKVMHTLLLISLELMIFKPKLEFFKSLGLSDLEITKLLSTRPSILERSLENQIIPCVQELRRILGIDENVLKAIKATYGIIEANVENVLKAHMFDVDKSCSLSHEHHMTEDVSDIEGTHLAVSNEPMCQNHDGSNKASHPFRGNEENTVKEKVEAYKHFGLSKDEIYSAFKRHLLFMAVSEKKIKKLMGFFVNKLKTKPLLISKNPTLLLLSLEKRIIPRYQNEVPDVVRAHQGKIEFQGFTIDLKM
ncbi:hypothetical protein SLA2020_421190 [Shorea laevis]